MWKFLEMGISQKFIFQQHFNLLFFLWLVSPPTIVVDSRNGWWRHQPLVNNFLLLFKNIYTKLSYA
jgi:hypothetical protein